MIWTYGEVYSLIQSAKTHKWLHPDKLFFLVEVESSNTNTSAMMCVYAESEQELLNNFENNDIKIVRIEQITLED